MNASWLKREFEGWKKNWLEKEHPPQSQRLRTRLPRKRTWLCSTSTGKERVCFFGGKGGRELTCGAETAGVASDEVGEDYGSHARLARAAFAHEQYLESSGKQRARAGAR